MRTLWLACLLVALGVALGATLCLAAEATAPPAVEVHGWSLTRFYGDITVDDTRDPVTGEISNEDKDSFFEEERISLYALGRLPEGRLAYGEVYIHPWLPTNDPSFLYLESLYFDTPVGDGARVRVGKGRNYAFGLVPSYGVRKFSNYSPVAETFTMDRVLGVQYFGNLGKNTLNFAVLNSQRPGQRFIGMTADEQLEEGSIARTTVPHLTARDVPADRSGQLEGDVRIGRQFTPKLNANLSAKVGLLDGTDTAFLESKFPGQVSGETHSAWGVDATYNSMPFYAYAEYYAGQWAGIDQSAWDVLFGIAPTKQCSAPWRTFSSACQGLFVRYSQNNIDVPRTLSQLTWDTQQLAFTYVFPLPFKGRLSGKWLQLEYELNTESPPAGVDEIPNNVLFLELFSAF